MYKWIDRITPIRHTILMRLPDHDFIPRQLEVVWAGELAQQWGNWELPQEEEAAPTPAEEEVFMDEEVPEDAEDASDDSDSDNGSTLTD